MKKSLVVLFFAIGLLSCKKENPQISVLNFPPVPPSSLGNGKYSFEYGKFYVEIDSAKAGKITSLQYDNTELLISSTTNATNFGNSLWPSPQSKWNWPPPAVLDVNPYDISIQGDHIILSSDTATPIQLLFRKDYSFNSAKSCLVIHYTIVNTGATAQSVAPWEITRVFPNGLTFFPRNATTQTGTLATLMEDSLDVTWFDYDPNTIPSGVPKLLANGEEGWMAHVSDSILFVKTFENISAAESAPGEAEIEFYANPNKTYIEIEQQGKYLSLAAGDSLEWTVNWHLQRLPSGTEIKVGNTKLLEAARKLANK